MAVAVQQPQREEDGLSKLAKALQIAQSVYGIRTSSAQLEEYAEKRAAAADQAKRDREGIISRKTALEMGKEYEPVAEGTAGAQKVQIDQGDGKMDVVWWKPKSAKLAPPNERPQEYAGKDGRPRIGRFVEGKGLVMGDGDPFAYVKPEAPPKDLAPKERDTLQNQYDRDPEVRKNKAVFSAYTEAQAFAKDPSPAADHALIMAYYKAMDPGSIVRETEAETAQAFGGLQARAEAKLKQLGGSGGLTEAQRTDLLAQIGNKAKAAAQNQQVMDEQFLGLAGRRGVAKDDLRFVKSPGFDSSGGDDRFLTNAKDDREAALAELRRRNVDVSKIGGSAQANQSLTPRQQREASDALKIRAHQTGSL